LLALKGGEGRGKEERNWGGEEGKPAMQAICLTAGHTGLSASHILPTEFVTYHYPRQMPATISHNAENQTSPYCDILLPTPQSLKYIVELHY